MYNTILGACQPEFHQNGMWIIMEYADGGSLYNLLSSKEGKILQIYHKSHNLYAMGIPLAARI